MKIDGMIKVQGTDYKCYDILLASFPKPRRYYEQFIEELRNVLDSKIESFKVPVCDPSFDRNGNIQFVVGAEPARGLYFNEWKEYAEKNGLTLMDNKKYMLFIATMMLRLKEEGQSITQSFHDMCRFAPIKYGHMGGLVHSKTGECNVAGKCDMMSHYKMLKAEDDQHFYLAVRYRTLSCGANYVIAAMDRFSVVDEKIDTAVPFFVF